MITGDDFIHWDDEEPYFIPEKYRSRLGNLEMSDFVDSSGGKSYTVFSLLVEEDEKVKKDIEWVKKEVDRYLSYEGVNEARKALVFAKGVINQLNEPEVLSQEWVDDNSVYASSDGITEEYVHVDDLQNLLVPKKELPVIPKYVAKYLEFAKSDVSLKRVLELASTRKELARWEEEYDWISANDETFARAWLLGYEVEEEPLYRVSAGSVVTGFWFLCKDNNGNIVIGTNKDYYEADWDSLKLTEQEIKDYDERYLAFKAPVEDVAE